MIMRESPSNHTPPLGETQAVKSLRQLLISHISFLTQEIGGRGSCTPQENRACQYVFSVMQDLGLTQVMREPFKTNRSTYLPFALAFGVALTGTLIALLFSNSLAFAIAALLNGLGAMGMLAETNLLANWMRWLLPKVGSCNVVGVWEPCEAQNEIRNQVVLCAHIDTHRTPIFYSSKRWHKIFGLLVILAFTSMLLGSILFFLIIFLPLKWLLSFGWIIALAEAATLSLCLHADQTPFSPGANDNASGVSICLAIANQLKKEPLVHTRVNFAFTGCEEVGARGIKAFLDQHGDKLDQNTYFIILDEVGLGSIKYLTQDGLVFQHPTHPRALALARETASTMPRLEIQAMPGLAYTDALVATQRGHIALTVCTLPGNTSAEESHWHQMSDTIEHIDPNTLDDVFAFTWEMLKIIDRKDCPREDRVIHAR